MKSWRVAVVVPARGVKWLSRPTATTSASGSPRTSAAIEQSDDVCPPPTSGAADVELADGRAFVRGAASRSVPLGEVVRAMSASGRPMQVLDKYDAPSAPTIDPRTGQGKPFNDYTFGTQAVEVEVDGETGQTRVSRLVACYDIGQAINRQSAEGQIEGGAVQGLGHALL